MAELIGNAFRDTLRSPGDQFRVSAHDKNFPTEPFDDTEATLLQQQLNDLVADLESSTLAKIVQQRQEIVAKVATLAKHDLEAKNFGGINAGDNEIGFSVLRPGHIRRDSGTGNIVNNWFFTPGATGWVDWIGNGAANNFAVDEDQVVLVLALVDQEGASSEISGVNVDTFGRNMDMLPRDVNSLRLMDNDTEVQVVQLQTLVGQEADEVHARLRFDRDVERQPRLFGFTFGLGRFMNIEDYATGDFSDLP